jgi:cytidylate kinase
MTAIAIDGPAGAGKSTVARAVADALGYTYIDTGAMYRAIALRALEIGIDPNDGDAAATLARDVDLALENSAVVVDGRDVSALIRSEEVTRASAQIAQHPGVREALVATQRRLARDGEVVMEGRDIGTKVLPDAEVKVFLTATFDERAARRAQDAGVTEPTELQDLKMAIAARDRSDMERKESPLVQAPDAVAVDSTGKSVAEVVDEIARLVQEAGR